MAPDRIMIEYDDVRGQQWMLLTDYQAQVFATQTATATFITGVYDACNYDHVKYK